MTTIEPSTAVPLASTVQRVAESVLPTPFADFRMRAYSAIDGKEHLALFLGRLQMLQPPLVRVHSECLTGDALFSQRCDCGPQLQESLRRVAAEGRGAVVYLRQEGRGIGLANKIRAYELQDHGDDTVEANCKLGLPIDGRDYLQAVDILRDLGISRVRLLTNNPRKIEALMHNGIEVVERVSLLAGSNPHNRHYLHVKATKLGHLMGPGDND